MEFQINGNVLCGVTGESAEMTVPAGVQEIAADALKGCRTVQAIKVPEGVRKIGARAFAGCTALRRISLPETLEILGDTAFFGCTSLQEITLPGGLKDIPASCFLGCKALHTAVLPERAVSIGTRAFSGCTFLRRVTMPAGCKKIAQDAFQGCNLLSGLIYPVRNPDTEFMLKLLHKSGRDSVTLRVAGSEMVLSKFQELNDLQLGDLCAALACDEPEYSDTYLMDLPADTRITVLLFFLRLFRGDPAIRNVLSLTQADFTEWFVGEDDTVIRGLLKEDILWPELLETLIEAAARCGQHGVVAVLADYKNRMGWFRTEDDDLL